ncbi:MAG: PAS domain-containing protein [Myxococcales bacterium]|nr:PAS domain-containing protein [Myxococcales bacterium]
MRVGQVQELVASTADAAFAIDAQGIVVAWNDACAALFGVPAVKALGEVCGPLVGGVDECGPVCSPECCVLQAAGARRPIGNFDLQVRTAAGMRWCNCSVLLVGARGAARSWSVHVLRNVDLRKRLEVLVRDFVVSSTGLAAADAANVLAVRRSPVQTARLTAQELAVLRLVAKGSSTAAIAVTLGIAPVTVTNHVQNVLRKLDAHSRLEAVRRAELAGLL